MARTQSKLVTKALARIAKGGSVHGTAMKLGISPSTLFRALKREREHRRSKGNES